MNWFQKRKLLRLASPSNPNRTYKVVEAELDHANINSIGAYRVQVVDIDDHSFGVIVNSPYSFTEATAEGIRHLEDKRRYK